MRKARALSCRTLLVAVIAMASASVASAQEAWPQYPIKLVVPFAAGSGTDTLARMIGDRLSANLKQPVVIENKVGASGIIGTRSVAEAQADGYTILMGTQTTQAANLALFKSVPYDPTKAFIPIGLVATVPVVVVVSPQLKVPSLADFVSLAKAKPDALTTGYGTGAAQVMVEMFQAATGTKFLGVPYKSNPQALTAVTANEISMMIGDLGTVKALAASNHVVPLAVSGKARTPLLPEIPTLQESGYEGFDAVAWYGIFAPAGTPPAIASRMQSALHEALGSPDFQAKMMAAGFAAAPGTPDQLAELVRDDIVRWAKYVRLGGIEPQ
ncbi:MAG: tripartite tricarboxylate transporter substrate-binding protein [Pseudorhodoplanes sp.]